LSLIWVFAIAQSSCPLFPTIVYSYHNSQNMSVKTLIRIYNSQPGTSGSCL
jgi:hypothetical protein